MSAEKKSDDKLITLRNITKHYPISSGSFGTRKGIVRAVDGVTLAINLYQIAITL